MENAREFLRSFCAAIAAAKMYPVEHPQVRMVVDKAFDLLREVLAAREEFILGIVEDEIVFETEVLFDLSAMMTSFIEYAKAKEIEKIYFYKGLKREELVHFIVFLFLKEDHILGDVPNHMASMGITNIKVSRLTTPLERKKKKFLTRAESYESMLPELKANFDKIIDENPEGSGVFLEVKFALFSVMENLMGKHWEFLHLDSLRNHDFTAAHSLNVALLAMHFSSKIGFIQEHVLDIGVASLVHDLGTYFIAKYGERETKMDQAFFHDCRLHPHLISAEILLRHQKTFGVLPVIVAFEQALPYHPQGRSEWALIKEIHISSQIVAICSYYDKVASALIGEKDCSPKRVYEKMMLEDRLFHPSLLEKFFNVLGLWPVGTIVRLSDERVGIVREQSDMDMLAPKIEIMPPRENEKFIVDLYEEREQLRIVKTLHPLGDGRDYVDYI